MSLTTDFKNVILMEPHRFLTIVYPTIDASIAATIRNKTLSPNK